MDGITLQAFRKLFLAAVLKCFGHPVPGGLSETESKLLSNRILESTGLVIGWKSLKNYSLHIHEQDNGARGNPLPASLDTLARYVLDAPYTNEKERRSAAGHFPYWFGYKNRFAGEWKPAPDETQPLKKPFIKYWIWGVLFVVIAFCTIYFIKAGPDPAFMEDFTENRNLTARGWMVNDTDRVYWGRRAEREGALTLFTVWGDSWPDTLPVGPSIRNLVYRKLPGEENWTVEVQLEDFLPTRRWQQAGMILMSDTGLTKPYLRVSLAFNDEFGGYPQSPEVLVQVITSLDDQLTKPEEIAHFPVLKTDSLDNHPELARNFDHVALRIEKRGALYRVLFSMGEYTNAAFHEVISRPVSFNPKYAGLFAIKGFVSGTNPIPVYFDSFYSRGF